MPIIGSSPDFIISDVVLQTVGRNRWGQYPLKWRWAGRYPHWLFV